MSLVRRIALVSAAMAALSACGLPSQTRNLYESASTLQTLKDKANPLDVFLVDEFELTEMYDSSLQLQNAQFITEIHHYHKMLITETIGGKKSISIGTHLESILTYMVLDDEIGNRYHILYDGHPDQPLILVIL